MLCPRASPKQVILGSRTLRCERIRGVEPGDDNTVPFRFLMSAIQNGSVVLEDQGDVSRRRG